MFLFLQSPYTLMMSDQVDLLEFEEVGHEVRILDGTRLLLPALVGAHGEEDLDERVVKLQNSVELEKIAQGMSPNDWIIFLGGFYQEQVHRSYSPYGILSKSAARLGAVYATHVPYQSFGVRQKLALKMLYEPNALIRMLFHRSFSAVKRIWSTQLAAAQPILVRPLERVWVGTKTPLLAAGLIDRNTAVRRIHSVDAETLRRIGTPTKQDQEYLVFMDTMGPLHPDYLMAPYGYRVPSDEYFKIITKALGEISSKSGKDVLIAAHPRALRYSLDEHYSPFKVEYFKSAELIRDSVAVLHPSSSASIGMAALLGKPMTFVFSKKLRKGLYLKIQQMVATELGCPHVDLERISQDFVLEEPDEAKYESYVCNYVSSNGWPRVSFWRQVVEDL